MIPFVLSGGSGTRLWPVSRESLPKHLCELFDESLLAKTARRLRPLSGDGEVGVVGAAPGEALTRRVLRDEGVSGRWALFEPVGRNTAPAVALVCHRLLQEGLGEEVVGVFPADHLVADEETFRRAVALAERVARGDGDEPGPVVTLGIRPSGPATGYGYVETAGDPVASEGDLAALPVRAFHEKPDATTARTYVEAGGYYWNAGMFVFRADRMAAAFERLMPELWRAIRTVEPDLSNLAEVYGSIEGESLDYGIMEHLSRGSADRVEQVTIPCDPGWSDVGSWDEVARLSRRRSPIETTEAAEVVEVGGHGNFVFSHDGRVYGLVGVDDLLVVDTEDALLIARRGRSQEVKEVVARLREAGRAQATEHAFDVRPWGRYDVLRDEADYKSKTIRVDPGQRLSYQSHRHRAEHWVIVRGRPRVVIDDRTLDLGPGDHVFIPRGAKHRISNPGEEPVLFVEVQVGEYFGEDDIVRYEDDYERT